MKLVKALIFHLGVNMDQKNLVFRCKTQNRCHLVLCGTTYDEFFGRYVSPTIVGARYVPFSTDSVNKML